MNSCEQRDFLISVLGLIANGTIVSESIPVPLITFVSDGGELSLWIFLVDSQSFLFYRKVPEVYRLIESSRDQAKIQPLFKCEIFKAVESHRAQRASTAEQAILIKSCDFSTRLSYSPGKQSLSPRKANRTHHIQHPQQRSLKLSLLAKCRVQTAQSHPQSADMSWMAKLCQFSSMITSTLNTNSTTPGHCTSFDGCGKRKWVPRIRMTKRRHEHTLWSGSVGWPGESGWRNGATPSFQEWIGVISLWSRSEDGSIPLQMSTDSRYLSIETTGYGLELQFIVVCAR